jgi:excisionase family DNA binding protein
MDRHYTIKRAAEELGKSRPTVYKMIRDGKLKIQTIAGRPVIAIHEVQRIKNANQKAD